MGKFSGDSFVFELTGELQDLRTRATRRTELNHYTNMDSLLKIFSSKTLKLNSIKHLNDKLEAKYISIDNLDDLVFVSSFCHGSENIPLWHMYTEPKYGVNITFMFDKEQGDITTVLYDESKPILGKTAKSEDMIKYNNIACRSVIENDTGWNIHLFCSDVKYDPNGIDNYQVYFPNIGKYNLTSMGVVKHSAWEYEEETRIIAHFKTLKTDLEMELLDFILVPITFEKLRKIVITFSPWMAQEVKNVIREFLIKEIVDCEIEFKDSIFTGIVDRKF